MISVSDAWKTAYPGAVVGVMALRNLSNPKSSDRLEEAKRDLESRLRLRYSQRSEIEADPVVAAYQAYYAQFRKTYHVLLQLESVALKGKPIPSVAPPVESMFLAELKNGVLTAGHDLDVAVTPLVLDISGGDEEYELLNSRQQVLKPGDMIMRDAHGVIASVIYGPDRRTRITPKTRNAFFVVYAPPGVRPEQVESHLGDIRDNVLLFSENTETAFLQTYVA